MKSSELPKLNCAVSIDAVKNADVDAAAHKAGTYVAPQTEVSRCVKLRSHDDGSRCPEPQALENQTKATFRLKTWNSLIKEADEIDAKVNGWLKVTDRPFSTHLMGQLDCVQRLPA